MNEPANHDCEALLSHAGWVRALARHLTADAHRADDLAQDALAAALVSPPPVDQSLRGWLSGIVRNLARQDRRGRARRGARERAVAREEADVSSAQLLERLDSHRTVVEAVARLDEPYRAAILMRYFEGLSPAAIAARTGTPLRTVHTRLHRALARLRADLDRTHGGDRSTWLLALIPFAEGSQRWSAAALGALVMDAKLKIAIAAIAIVGVGSTLVLWRSDSQAGSPPPAVTMASAESVDGARGSEPALADAPAPTEQRAQISAPIPVASAAGTTAPTSARLSGRVIDVDRSPVAGVKVRCFESTPDAHADPEVTTDAAGGFELAAPLGSGRVDIASPGWTSVFRPEFTSASAAGELVLVVARSVRLGGVVVNERHHAIPSANVAVPLPMSLRSRFDAILDGSSTVERAVKCGPDGRFDLQDVPIFPGAKLVTTHAAFLSDERDLPAQDELALEIVLRSASTAAQSVTGHVVDADGAPVEGAWVALGAKTTKSGPAGAFSFDLSASSPEPSATRLRAVKDGHLPATIERSAHETWPDPLLLRLRGTPLTIEGRVVDADGNPVARAHVWVDETSFGSIAIEGGEMAMSAGASFEGILRGDPWAPRIRAGADGRFTLSGLMPAEYSVHALDKARLRVTTSTIAAGSRNVELRMPSEPVHERVAGRITSLSGEPIQGAQVVLERTAEGIASEGIERLQSAAATTDADGRFAFGPMPRSITTVIVSGDGFDLFGVRRSITEKDDVTNLAFAVPMRVHVQIDAGAQADFDEAVVLDGQGERLEITLHHGASSYTMREIPVQEGRTEPFSVSEAGQTLVLYKGDVEQRRLPLKLVRGGLNTIRP